MKSNSINFSIPASVVKEATDALELAYAKLTPYLLTDITQSQLEGYGRMGKNGQMFVNDIFDCIQQDENLIPRAYSKEEALADKSYYAITEELSTRMNNMADILTMNRDLAGIELLDFANEVYSTIKRRNHEGDPLGKSMFERVKTRYARNARKRKDTPGN
jgi:hypothetical protein